MTFYPQKFAAQGGTLSEKLATVFNAVGMTNGEATSGDYGRLMGSGGIAAALANANATTDVKLQISQSFTAMGSGETGGAAYFKAVTGGAIAGQLATAMVRTTLGHNVFDAYGLQSHLTISDTTIATTDANAHLTAISGKVSFSGTPTVSKGWVNAGLFIAEGTGTCSQMCHVVSIVCEAGTTGPTSLLHLNSDVDIMAAFAFAGVQDSGHMIDATDHAAGASSGGIRVLINGAAAYIPFDLV